MAGIIVDGHYILAALESIARATTLGLADGSSKNAKVARELRVRLRELV